MRSIARQYREGELAATRPTDIPGVIVANEGVEQKFGRQGLHGIYKSLPALAPALGVGTRGT